jgi:hypothetical protein
MITASFLGMPQLDDVFLEIVEMHFFHFQIKIISISE